MRDVRAVHAFVEKHRRRRQSNKVLHGHPSPVHWLDPDIAMKMDEVLRTRARTNQEIRKRVNLYVGTPYCLPTEPDRCGFCLFPTEIYTGRRQLDEYLGYLEREGDLFRDHFAGAELASIYFGGGTSNLYKPDQYPRLMEIVRGVFDIPPHIEVTLEGIPQTFSHDKLLAMKQSGMTRVSMGVQQLDNELIKASGRKQRAHQVFQTLEWCEALGLPASVDLIFGWPNQTIEQMVRDLEAVAATGVSHITHYELNVAGRTDFSRNRRGELPSTEENLEMYRMGKAVLEACGYTQVTPYDFERRDAALPSSYLYEELFRKPFQSDENGPIGFDAWGWGYAGISFFFGTPQSPGWAFVNQIRVDEYFRCIREHRYPAMRGFHYTPTDLRLHLLFQEMQGLAVDRTAYLRFFGIDVVEEHAPVWDAFDDLGWVTVSDDRVTVHGDGVFYLPLIQNALAHDRLEQMRRKLPATSIPVANPVPSLAAEPTPAEPSRV
ncbi:MAG: radical SAM protein [Vicinamibacterales bacterium]|jgi:oxygen-independent coproporphyrinogen-3 oxidase|nr:radical SAM protein [Vicinamibacterales bacterium]HJN46373.1 radical SAM protein [Vicinamibacterales bacterium]|tara:strand:- start:2406 stop:3878 length:1473 start_codon:yes stop_codon:yes gene_type:complete